MLGNENTTELAILVGPKTVAEPYLRPPVPSLTTGDHQAVGPEMREPAGDVIFVSWTLAAAYEKAAPAQGFFGMLVTRQAKQRYGLDRNQWQQILAAQGLAPTEPGVGPEHRCGIRRAYAAAHASAYRMGEVILPSRFPMAGQIEQRGLMVRGGWLPHTEFPRMLSETPVRGNGHLAALDRHFRVPSSPPTAPAHPDRAPETRSSGAAVRVAFAGRGNIPGLEHARNLAQLGITPCLFDLDLNQSGAVAPSFGGLVFASEDEFLARKTDGAIVAVPRHVHPDWVEKFLRTGSRHLLVETPFALSLPEAKRALDLAGGLGATISAGYHQLLMLEKPLEFVRSGLVGTLTAIDYRWICQDGSPEPLLDLGSHGIALAMALQPGLPHGVTAAATNNLTTVTVSWPHFVATIHLETNSTTLDARELGSVRFICDQGEVRTRFRTALTAPPGPSVDYRPIVLRRGQADQYLDHEIPPMEEVRYRQIRMWVQSIRGGLKLPIIGEAIERIQKVQDAAFASVAARGKSIDPRQPL